MMLGKPSRNPVDERCLDLWEIVGGDYSRGLSRRFLCESDDPCRLSLPALNDQPRHPCT
jgi:hypothetical protein